MADASVRNEDLEYDCQFFTFDRKYLKECIKAMVEDQIHRQVRAALGDLTEALALPTDQVQAAEDKLGRIDKFFCKNAEQPLERINKCIDEHMSVPRYVILPEDVEYGSAGSMELEALQLETKAARDRALAAGATARLLRRELESVRNPALLKARAAAEARIRAVPSIPPTLPRLDKLLTYHSTLPSDLM